MTKKYWLLLVLVLSGCGATSTGDVSNKATLQTHDFVHENRSWQIKVPSTWEVLSPEKQVLFMARNGDQNIAILERDQGNKNPVEQIISSAKQQFFKFDLKDQSANAWKFVGQPGPTNTPRTFWQQIKTVPEARKFLLASCSQHEGSPTKSSCASILKSWKEVVEK